MEQQLNINRFDEFSHPYFQLNFINKIALNGNCLELNLKLPFAAQTIHAQLSEQLQHYAKKIFAVEQVTVNIETNIIAHKIKAGLKRAEKIKNIIAVSSGKGGVGKSTTAVNLAISLAKNGANVGILDADIYGPSLPTLLNALDYKPEVDDNNFVPLAKYGIKAMSFGFLIDSAQPAIWRGAIVNKAIEQMFFDSAWGELDYLIVDMPPGTGDIHLTMAQKIPLTANIVVTTPQDIALVDVGKSIAMYEKLSIPCLGVVENMATHICPNCQHQSDIFGSGGMDKLQQKYHLPLLAKLPLDASICNNSDKGIPSALSIDHIAQIYNSLALNVAYNLSKLGKDYSQKIPTIQIVKK